MPTRLGGSFSNSRSSASRLIFRRRTTVPSGLKPTTWNTSFPMSIPIDAIAGASWPRWLLKVAPPQLGA
jgi:hypothetical protein